MRILDENGIEIESPDLAKGYLKNDSVLVQHHEPVEAVEEVGHYEVVAEYPNGGKDVAWVVDTPGVQAQEAWDEFEEILRYIPYTETELRIREFEKNRKPLTLLDALGILLTDQISTLSVDDTIALRMKEFYPEWAPGNTYLAGARLRRNGALWKVRGGQGHTSQVGWEPENVPALFERIDETHAGTLEDPIPYEGNMALVNGLHYYQSGRFFLCTRDTVNPVYHALSELVGLYVKPIE